MALRKGLPRRVPHPRLAGGGGGRRGGGLRPGLRVLEEGWGLPRALGREGRPLSVANVPDRVADPDGSFTVQLRVTNSSGAPIDFVAQDPGRLVAYLARSGRVSGGWSRGTALPSKSYVVQPGQSRSFDVVVRGEGCVENQPMVGGTYQVVAGIATVKDGQTYLWTARGDRITYPS